MLWYLKNILLGWLKSGQSQIKASVWWCTISTNPLIYFTFAPEFFSECLSGAAFSITTVLPRVNWYFACLYDPPSPLKTAQQAFFKTVFTCHPFFIYACVFMYHSFIHLWEDMYGEKAMVMQYCLLYCQTFNIANIAVSQSCQLGIFMTKTHTFVIFWVGLVIYAIYFCSAYNVPTWSNFLSMCHCGLTICQNAPLWK